MKLTKEQVLKNLEDIVRFGGLTMSSEFVESVRIAMEAYEQEPCEDCISRQAVLEQTYNWSKDEFLRVTNPFDYLRKRINSLPSSKDAISKTIVETLENLLTECGDMGHFHVDGNDYQLTQLINELKNGTKAGKEFQKNVCDLITVYLMKFGGEECADSVQLSEPCEDTISLADVFEIMGSLLSIPYDFDRNITETDMKKAMDDIKELKRVQPKAEWIPVNKRLPKAGEYVGNIPKYYLVQNEFGDMLVARYTHSEYWEQIYQHKPIADEIVAWMPLPEPYKKESGGKE